MVNKELLQQKINLQKIKNLMKQVNGIDILDYEKGVLKEDILRNAGYCDPSKKAESCITFDSSESDIIDWILKSVSVSEEEICYLFYDNIYKVKVRVINKKQMLSDLWRVFHRISILNQEKNLFYEVEMDSRDEYNYLFDIYSLDQLC